MLRLGQKAATRLHVSVKHVLLVIVQKLLVRLQNQFKLTFVQSEVQTHWIRHGRRGLSNGQRSSKYV